MKKSSVGVSIFFVVLAVLLGIVGEGAVSFIWPLIVLVVIGAVIRLVVKSNAAQEDKLNSQQPLPPYQQPPSLGRGMPPGSSPVQSMINNYRPGNPPPQYQIPVQQEKPVYRNPQDSINDLSEFEVEYYKAKEKGKDVDSWDIKPEKVPWEY